MKRIMAAAASLLLLTGCGGDPHANDDKSLDLFAMDTYMNLKAYGSHAEAALPECAARITGLEQMLSVTDERSEIWAANHANGAPVPVSADTQAIWETAQQVSAESGGALCVTLYPLTAAWGFTTGSYQVPAPDVIAEKLELADDSRVTLADGMLTVPAECAVDFGALAKGYTSDAVMEIMREQGVTSAVVSLGGNVQTLGTKPDGSKWSVGIQDPFDSNQLLGVLKIADRAVITSGNYERYFDDEAGNRWWHIIDPADGYPADNGLVSVTVVGESGLRCDALSTALFVEGTEQAIAHWRRCDDFEMVLVTSDGTIYLTEGIEQDFTKSTDLPQEVLHR